MLMMSLCACSGGKTPADSDNTAPSTDPEIVEAQPDADPVDTEPEEPDVIYTPSDDEYTGTRGADDPNVLFGIWDGQIKMYDLEDDYSSGEKITFTACFNYDADGRSYFKGWIDDEDDPFLFVYMQEDSHWRDGIRTDYARPEIGDKDCWIFEHFMTAEHDGSTYSVVVNNGKIETLCDHEYIDASGHKYELQFDLVKDTSAKMD